jgi:hypothetical protein
MPSFSAFFISAFSAAVRYLRLFTTVIMTTAWLRLECALRCVNANALRQRK